jgi:hypothetical protein
MVLEHTFKFIGHIRRLKIQQLSHTYATQKWINTHVTHKYGLKNPRQQHLILHFSTSGSVILAQSSL